MRIYYIGFYDFPDSDIERDYFPAQANKMTYITRVLQGIDPDTEIVSVSLPRGNRFSYSGKTMVKDGIKVHFIPFCRLFSHHGLKDRWRSICLFFYGLFRFTSADVVMSYHIPSFSEQALILLRKIKKFKVVLEVEEIYANLLKRFYSVQLKREMLGFNNCDGYIFSTELLDERINKNNLPSIIIYGIYQKVMQPRIIRDKMIHVVYAGTFDPQKGGAFAAAAAAAYLPKNYCVHICGFGTEEATKSLESQIANLQRKGYNIRYEGLLKGRDYVDFLLNCHIGVSTQDPSADFNDTSFPSKILSYMSAGLAVVSIKTPAIANSAVGGYISYYDLHTPEEIAKGIMACDISQGERNREVIASLDADFKRDINLLIQKVTGAQNYS